MGKIWQSLQPLGHISSKIQTLNLGYLSSNILRDIRWYQNTIGEGHDISRWCITYLRFLVSGSFSPKEAALEIHVRGQVAYIDFIRLSWVNLPGTSPSKGKPWDVVVHEYYWRSLVRDALNGTSDQLSGELLQGSRWHQRSRDKGGGKLKVLSAHKVLMLPFRRWKEYPTATTTTRGTKPFL